MENKETKKEIVSEITYPQFHDGRPCAKLSAHPTNPSMLVDEKKGIFYIIMPNNHIDMSTGNFYSLEQLNHEEGYVPEEE